MSLNKQLGMLAVAVACVVTLAFSSSTSATPYASGIQLNGVNSSFILNQGGANVSVVYDGGATVVPMGMLAAGTHTFDATLGSSWEIVCTSSAPAGWTQISDDNLTQSKYYSPRGVAVNQNSASASFGRIYVSEGLGGAVSAGGRTTTDGLYVMGSDQSDMLGQGDTAASGTIDWTTGGSNSPYKISIGPDDSIYLTDWSDAHSGLWRAPADLSGTWPNVLANNNRAASGLCDNHGSIPAVWVEGTGDGTQVYTLDEDFALPGTTGSVLRYDVGTATDYNGQPVEQTQDGTNIILNMRADVVRDADGSWWIAQYRFTESAGAPSLTRFLDGGTAPIYNSGADDNLPLLYNTYGNIDIHNELDLLILGARSSSGVYVIDIQDPANPALLDTIPQTDYVMDVAFDIAGNVYVVSNSTETLRIWSPGGNWIATTGSDGSFTLAVPEPSTIWLLVLSGLALIWFRRRVSR
ncbi:MAG: PEP-CTERM sorting domain-containing protein [Pirellulales bacterium]|nr:PEP-CTERM sorting domain-containing protein [Pirellulales bacterium]